MRTLLSVPLLVPLLLPAQDGGELQLAHVVRAAVARHADHAHALYAHCVELALELRARLGDLVRDPSPETLAAARSAWLAGRDVYGLTEALRFSGGPIDDARTGVETLVNAWPLDEAYVDAVQGRPDCGIVNDRTRYPHLDAELCVLLNEHGGEANVCVGWHAIEFLLWGQDLDPAGPGNRSHEDYVADQGRNADRRGAYLLLLGDLLVRHLTQIRDAWAPDAANYRARFLAAAPEKSLRGMLAGVTILSAFEMAGERLAVAYETQDQEDEHSCFSDNTHADFVANQLGVIAVWRGEAPAALGEPRASGPGLRDVARCADAALADQIEKALEGSLAALRGIPIPFDQAIRGADDAPGRRAAYAALVALERQAQLLASLGLALGHEIALLPGG